MPGLNSLFYSTRSCHGEYKSLRCGLYFKKGWLVTEPNNRGYARDVKRFRILSGKKLIKLQHCEGRVNSQK